mgnify:CR=1 FL=1
MNKAIPLLLIIPFLLLAGCQEQPKPEIEKPEPIAYQLVCSTDLRSAEAKALLYDFSDILECLKANPPPTASYIFEADVLGTKKGEADESYQSCNRAGELVELSNEWPMTVSGQYLTFKGTISAGSTKIIKVDRRTLKLDHYSEPRNMSCKLNDIFDDRAI